MGPRHARVLGWAKSYTKKLDDEVKVEHDLDAVGALSIMWSLVQSIMPQEVQTCVDSWLAEVGLGLCFCFQCVFCLPMCPPPSNVSSAPRRVFRFATCLTPPDLSPAPPPTMVPSSSCLTILRHSAMSRPVRSAFPLASAALLRLPLYRWCTFNAAGAERGETTPLDRSEVYAMNWMALRVRVGFQIIH